MGRGSKIADLRRHSLWTAPKSTISVPNKRVGKFSVEIGFYSCRFTTNFLKNVVLYVSTNSDVLLKRIFLFLSCFDLTDFDFFLIIFFISISSIIAKKNGQKVSKSAKKCFRQVADVLFSQVQVYLEVGML